MMTASATVAVALGVGLAGAPTAEASVPYQNWVRSPYNWVGVVFHPHHTYWTQWEIWRNSPNNNYRLQWRYRGSSYIHSFGIPSKPGHYWQSERIKQGTVIYFRVYDWDFPSGWVRYHT
ncbi:hypothetical protein [Actinomadura rupiterrae]|uniref:hypothetical protein n=1 Tax=Actinomadura rupiterrae TaxID=559627 RepID=UPI0020A5A28C|nr:hypothetical protein [Actinomadura rupiterrae]MCP2343652.1 hypothetical protein [Actinomadura rupiterrae]